MKLRVALLNQYYAPAEAATAQLLSDLGEHLAARGHDVSAICSRRSYPDPLRTYPARETLRGVSVFRTWTTGFGRKSRFGRLLDYLSYLVGATGVLLTQPRFDVVVSLTTPPMIALLGVLSSRLRGSRSLFWVMDIYPDVAFELGVMRRGSLAARALDRISRFILSRSDRVVALGERMAQHLEGLGANDVEVIHNWADGEAIRPRPLAGHALRTDWGWNDRFVVLYSGNMGLAHDFDTVLDAAELLRDDPRVLFAFVGSGPRKARVESEVARRSLANVELRPHLEREVLGQSLTSGDVHLITMRDGVSGLLVPSKIYGVLAAGRPALYVGPEDGEIAGILREGNCGQRFALGDAQGLAQAIRRLADAPALAAEAGARARRLFDERFSSHRALASHRRLIESLGEQER